MVDTEGLEPSKVLVLNQYAVPFAINPHVQLGQLTGMLLASAERRGNASAIMANCPKSIYHYPHVCSII